MLVTRVVLGAGAVNVRGLKTLRTSGLCEWAPSILHMASIQEMRFKLDQESTLDSLQLINTLPKFGLVWFGLVMHQLWSWTNPSIVETKKIFKMY